jgi:AcrR family transcriptional regulator
METLETKIVSYRFVSELVHSMEVKDKILRASFGLFCRRGIKSVSMDDIATHLSISKKTIYKWFHNKDQVVDAALRIYLFDINVDCCQISNKASNAIEELFTTMQMIRQKMAGVHPAVFYDLQKYHPEAYQNWVTFKNEVLLQQILDNLRKGVAEGFYRPDFDLEIMARLRLLQVEHAFNPEFFPPEKFNLQQVQLTILEHFMLGIATLKGHRLINAFKKVTEEE